MAETSRENYGRPEAAAPHLVGTPAAAESRRCLGDRPEVGMDLELDVVVPADPVDRSVADAIRHGELQLWYQPVVRIDDQSVAGVEALVRWAHPNMGLLSPDRFLPGAQRAGHLAALDHWVLTRACVDFVALCRDLKDQAPKHVAVNLSPATLAADFDQLIETVLANTGLSPSRLLVELPEYADLDTLTAATPRLERLRCLGVGLILDDMGAGHTSLRHLSAINVRGLKIDGALINGVLHNPHHRAVIKLLAGLGRGMQLTVTAEGVETAEQLAALADLDIEYAQGYHLGRPQPLHQLISHLKARGLAHRPQAGRCSGTGLP